ncbi:MAG: hypothetical protein K9K39_04305 [Desulfohalobiaceae bacterium]|nr:hypothetical protein [Desulfohalobiaceae bacterium]
MTKPAAVICQLLGAVIGAYGASSIMAGGAGWGSVFLGVVLIFFGSKSFLQSPAREKPRRGEKGDR